MIAAHGKRRPIDARVLVLDARGHLSQWRRADWTSLLQRSDLVIANDGATLPASLTGVHIETRARVEVRLAARRSLDPHDIERWVAVVFGDGDWRTRTEERPLPPRLRPGDRLLLGGLRARIEALLDHPRLVRLTFDATPDAFWHGLTTGGRPIQYAHLVDPLALWDVQTPIAGPPAALEPPSATFAIDWRTIARLRERGIAFATLTHAAGLSSTGDPALDARLPLDEPYAIPETTAHAVARARRAGGRLVAIGTTVVRALEHAASTHGTVRAGSGTADNRVGADTTLAVVDALLTGTHEPGSSHFELLRAFHDEATLARAVELLDRNGYRTHEFGDSMLIARAEDRQARSRRTRPAVAA